MTSRPGTANRKPDKLLDSLRSHRPSTIGNYALGDKIGIGTFGKVHKAIHRLTGQQVAIKVIKRDPRYMQSIEREIDTWRRLRHPNIAQLYEVIVSESKIFMVMEYAGGGEVLSYIKQLDGPLPGQLAKRLFLQLILAVKYCHDRMVVHRDLKLENIMLDGTMSSVKLIDFGFSRHFESKHKFLETLCGSVAYVAPEILGGKKYSGPAADIWSLGVLLYTFVCGMSPFEEESQIRTQARILGMSYEFPDWIDPDARDLIEKILLAEPNHRMTIESMLMHPWLAEETSRHNQDAFLFNGADYNKNDPATGSLSDDINGSGSISSSGRANPAVNVMKMELHEIQRRQSQLKAEAGDLRAIRSQNAIAAQPAVPPSQQVLDFMARRPLEERCLLYHLTMLGYDTAEMVRSISEYACDQLSAVYFLLLEKLRGADNCKGLSTVLERLLPQQHNNLLPDLHNPIVINQQPLQPSNSNILPRNLSAISPTAVEFPPPPTTTSSSLQSPITYGSFPHSSTTDSIRSVAQPIALDELDAFIRDRVNSILTTGTVSPMSEQHLAGSARSIVPINHQQQQEQLFTSNIILSNSSILFQTAPTVSQGNSADTFFYQQTDSNSIVQSSEDNIANIMDRQMSLSDSSIDLPAADANPQFPCNNTRRFKRHSPPPSKLSIITGRHQESIAVQYLTRLPKRSNDILGDRPAVESPVTAERRGSLNALEENERNSEQNSPGIFGEDRPLSAMDPFDSPILASHPSQTQQQQQQQSWRKLFSAGSGRLSSSSNQQMSIGEESEEDLADEESSDNSSNSLHNNNNVPSNPLINSPLVKRNTKYGQTASGSGGVDRLFGTTSTNNNSTSSSPTTSKRRAVPSSPLRVSATPNWDGVDSAALNNCTADTAVESEEFN